MKRLTIAVLILVLLVAANLYTHSLLDKTGTDMLQRVEELEQLTQSTHTADLEKACQRLLQQWVTTEQTWSRFLRSDRLEAITIQTARLPSLAHHGQTAEVAAGLCEIRILLQEVLAFESPSFSDVFS
ncbi:MAG: DUF4363 family protein [Oscillospiraceae bacterium]|nr:DUF4363 family protein [Oscillospiraceae bacterium]